MTFVKLYEFCEAFVQSAITMIHPVLEFFTMQIGEYLQMIKYVVPPYLRPFVDGFRVVIDVAGISDTPMISFLFGGAILFYLAYTFIKWILDVAL